MKKYLYLMITIIVGAVILFSGCGNKDGKETTIENSLGSEDKIVAVVDGFFTTMQSGDFSKMTEYCTEDVLASQQLDVFTDEEALESALFERFGFARTGLTLDDLNNEAKEAIVNAGITRMSNLINSYEISDVSVNRKTAEVTGTVTYGYDTEYDIDVEGFIAEYRDSFSTDQVKEYANIYANEGEDAMKKKMVNDMLPGLMEKYSSSLQVTEGATNTLHATVEKIDGKWLITALNITPAEEAGVSE